MLVIRLARTGRRNQATYRLVVAEKARPVQGKHLEILGFYSPAESKKFDFEMARAEYWIGKGAQPSDAAAALMKSAGLSGMEKFIAPRNKKRAKKNPTEAELAAAAPAPVAAPAETPAPAAEEAAA